MSATSISRGALAVVLLVGAIAAADPIVVTPMPIAKPAPPSEPIMTPEGMTPPPPPAAPKVATPAPRRALAVAANTAGLRASALGSEPGGAAHLIVHEACARASRPARHARAGVGLAHTYDGSTVLATDGKLKLEVKGWPLWPGGVQLAFGACPGLTD